VDDIRLTVAMKNKFDKIHRIWHDQNTKTENDNWFKPYFLEIRPLSNKNQHISINTNTYVQGKSADADIHEFLLKANHNGDWDSTYDEFVEMMSKKKPVGEDAIRIEEEGAGRFDFNEDGLLNRHDFYCEYRINDKVVELGEEEIQKSLEKMENSLRNRMYEITHNQNYVDQTCGRLAVVWYALIMVTVIVSITGTICSTVEKWSKYDYQFEFIEFIVTIILTVEYIVTFLVVRNKCSYVFTFGNVVDFSATIPWYIWWAIGEKLRHLVVIGNILRTLRVLRLFRARELSSPYILLLFGAVKQFFLGTGFAVALVITIACLFLGSLMFAAQDWDPESGFDNIFMGMWFVIVTMSTVGYGDISPTTPFGYACGLLTIIVGVTIFSLLLMIIGQYYSNELDDYNDEITDIKKLLLESVNNDEKEFREMLINESEVDLYNKIEYPLRCEKNQFRS